MTGKITPRPHERHIRVGDHRVFTNDPNTTVSTASRFILSLKEKESNNAKGLPPERHRRRLSQEAVVNSKQ